MSDMGIKVILEEANVNKDFFTSNRKENNLKCPFCQQEIKIAGEHTTIMSCFNGDCKGSGLYGEKAFWQELIRTRKALGIAVGALKRTDWCAQDYAIAQEALNKITALEQKD